MTRPLTLDVTSPGELAAALDGLSDAEITASIRQLGLDDALHRAFASMAARFVPERARGERAAIQWEIETPDGERVHTLTVDGRRCAHTPGPIPRPHVTIGTSVASFLRLIAGRVHGLQAYADGELRLRGDLVIAQLQQLWFDVDLSGAVIRISTPSQLRKLISGRSEEEIEAAVHVLGPDVALDKVFQGMVDHFLPEKASRRCVVAQFSVRTPQGDKAYHLFAGGGSCRYGRGRHEAPNVTLLLRLPSLLRIAAGELDGVVALVRGQVKVKGNILLARSLQSWFDRRA